MNFRDCCYCCCEYIEIVVPLQLVEISKRNLTYMFSRPIVSYSIQNTNGRMDERTDAGNRF